MHKACPVAGSVGSENKRHRYRRVLINEARAECTLSGRSGSGRGRGPGLLVENDPGCLKMQFFGETVIRF
jgi:hypothetical protein